MIDKKCIFRLLFEQSGCFKKVLNDYGYIAYDYDIKNEYCCTDYQLDLFKEIDNCYNGFSSIFDSFNSYDYLFAFFPCTRFENQIGLCFRGENFGFKNFSLEQKLVYDLKLHNELNLFYCILSKLVIICLRRGLKLVIENPYSLQHYLLRYWCCKPTVIEFDRSLNGDYFKKPTMFYFFNFSPTNCFIKADLQNFNYKLISFTNSGKERSELSLVYIRYFLSRYIFDFDYVSSFCLPTQLNLFDFLPGVENE